MLKIVGVQRKSGEFQNKHYDNIMLHCLNDSPSVPTIAGDVCETIKLKASEIGYSLNGFVKNDADYLALIGMGCVPFFDRYGRCIRCDIVDLS